MMMTPLVNDDAQLWQAGDCIAIASMLFLVFHKEEKVNEKRVKKRSFTTPHKVPSFIHTLGFYLFISRVVAGEQTNGILL
jgi:hypothetical protein